MKKLKLSAKIIGGFAIVILLMIGVIGVYQFSSIKTTRGFINLLSNDVAQVSHAHQADILLQRALHATSVFMVDKDMKEMARHAQYVDGLLEHLDILKKFAQGEGDQGQIKVVEDSISQVGQYRSKVEELVVAYQAIGLTDKEGLLGKFRQGANALQIMLPEHELNVVIVALLQIRRYENDYLVNRDEGSRDKFNAAIKEYETVLNSPDVVPPPEVKKVLSDNLVKYQRAAASLLANPEVGQDANVAELRSAANESETAVRSANVPRAKAMMLEICKQEKDYLLTQDDTYVQANKAAVAKLRETFIQSGVLQEHIDDVVVTLDTYEKAFASMVAENAVINGLKLEVKEVAEKLDHGVDAMGNRAEKDGADIAKDIVAQAKRLAGIALAASLATIILALALAFGLVRSICRPIANVVKNLTTGAEQLAAASGQVSSSSQMLAEGATEQAASLEETSASMEEMHSMTRQNSDNSSQADVLMRESLSTIKEADASMVEMGRSMNEIAEASTQTSKIIKTIDEIAFQTNLLALNAAVEAARAGEAGAGFAVVAEEVRNLAMRSTEAAKNTASLIEGTVSKVAIGKSIVARATDAFQGVAVSSAKVAGLIGEIASASREQAQGFGQINQAITQMDTVTQQNSATAEESAAAAAELDSQSASMMDIVKNLKELVDGGGAASKKTIVPPVQTKPKVLAAPSPRSARTSAKSPEKPLSAPPPAAQPRLASVPRKPAKETGKVNPKDIIPMDDDDTFEDF